MRAEDGLGVDEFDGSGCDQLVGRVFEGQHGADGVGVHAAFHGGDAVDQKVHAQGFGFDPAGLVAAGDETHVRCGDVQALVVADDEKSDLRAFVFHQGVGGQGGGHGNEFHVSWGHAGGDEGFFQAAPDA